MSDEGLFYRWGPLIIFWPVIVPIAFLVNCYGKLGNYLLEKTIRGL